MEFINLSNNELYYSKTSDIISNVIFLNKEESKHIISVMRHRMGDLIYVTNGLGKIYQCRIEEIKKENILLNIVQEFSLPQKYPNITVCVPILRNQERLEFALEKATELGITNFILFHSERSIPKKINRERVEKIFISAVKQSLQSWLPNVIYVNSTNEIASKDGDKIVFDQSSKVIFCADKVNVNNKSFFIFGPEGGLTKKEIETINTSQIYRLADNRLRTETAIIKAVSQLSF